VSIGEQPADCWEWTGGHFADGYGAINVGGKPSRAHRVSYELFTGPVGDWHVLHACDNPNCVNPAHLSLGTPRDNADDKVKRGRTSRTTKITDAQVSEIRESTATYRELADRYGVSFGLIAIIRGRRGHRVARPVAVSRRKEMALAKKMSKLAPASR
jgi:hypothetical protein